MGVNQCEEYEGMNRRDIPGGANTGEVIPTHFRWKGPDAHKGHPIGINRSLETRHRAT